jgi:hypothetical protein
MRYLRMAAVTAIVAVAAIAVLRLADVITPAQLPWLANRALGVIALLLLAGIGVGALAGRTQASESAERPIP